MIALSLAVAALAIITAPVCIWLMRRCRHKFTLIRTVKIHSDQNEWIKDQYILQCAHCGEIRSETV